MSEEVEAGDWFVLPGSTVAQLAVSVTNEVVTYEDERGMETRVPLASVKKAADPFPKLTKSLNQPLLWVKTSEDVLIELVEDHISKVESGNFDNEIETEAEASLTREGLKLIAEGESRDPSVLAAVLVRAGQLRYKRY